MGGLVLTPLRWRLSGVALIGLSVACGSTAPGSSPAAHPPAATVANGRAEGELTTLTLSVEAQKHLALEMKTVALEPVSATRTIGAEAIVPPGKTVTVSAPMAGTLSRAAAGTVGPVTRGAVLFQLMPLQPADRDVRAEADRMLSEAEARLTQTTTRVRRLEQLLTEGSASVRAVEDAQADMAVASAAAVAARQRAASVSRTPGAADGQLALIAPFDGFVTDVRAADGQTVAAGAAIADVAQTASPWIRAAVFTGDVGSIDPSQAAAMADLGQTASGPWRPLRRVNGPPIGNPAAASVDLYFEPTGAATFPLRPGQRVVVRLPLRSVTRALVVPRAAVIYDINGGSWVYVQRGPNQFARRRVELGGPSGSGVVVVRGLAEGVTVVTVGAAELYGTEFYVSK